MPKDTEIKWGPCRFCGQQIADSEYNPCRVTVETRTQKWQVLFCDAECFRERLAPIPILEPAHF